MPKSKKVIDNSWILDGMYAYRITQADLAREASIPADRLNKSVKNRRDIRADEYQRIMDVFNRRKAETNLEIGPPFIKRPAHAKESFPTLSEGQMHQGGGLLDLLGDITRRLTAIEDRLRKIEETSPEPRPRPTKGRRTS